MDNKTPSKAKLEMEQASKGKKNQNQSGRGKFKDKKNLVNNTSKEKNEPAAPRVPPERIEKYVRPTNYKTDRVNKDLIGEIGQEFRRKEKHYYQASKQAARTELLLTEQVGYIEADEGEHTSEITQTDIANAVDITSAQKHFDLNLQQFGPYRSDYTRNGRHLLLGGAKGHIAALDWQTKKLMCELNVMESCYDVKWLHIETMFAVAQKRWVYIYDNQGIELHCLKTCDGVLRMEFLPYHFLLAAASSKGFIQWIDTSIGQNVAGFHTNEGRLDVMCHNPANAIIHLGHTKGTVTLWSPNVNKPVVKMLCHKGGGVRSVCVDNTGMYMSTSGVDRIVKTWDLRQYREVHSCKVGHGAASLSFSQNGLLASAMGNMVEVYKDPRKSPITEPYLRHRCQRAVQNIQFCPYEDVLGAAHAQGFTSLLVPGAGEANFDALEANPFQTKKQRQQAEVKMLLEKIQPDMITLDTRILGKVNEETAEDEFKKQVDAYLLKPQKIQFRPKFRKKGANKASRVEQRKQGVKAAAKRDTIKHLVRQTQQSAREKKQKQNRKSSVLNRFKKPKD